MYQSHQGQYLHIFDKYGINYFDVTTLQIVKAMCYFTATTYSLKVSRLKAVSTTKLHTRNLESHLCSAFYCREQGKSPII